MKEAGHYRREYYRSKGFGDTLCKTLKCKSKLMKAICKKLNKVFKYK